MVLQCRKCSTLPLRASAKNWVLESLDEIMSMTMSGRRAAMVDPKCARILFDRAVNDHFFDGIPCSKVLVSFRLPTTNVDDIMTSLYKGRQ
jgi:hypothetical protein